MVEPDMMLPVGKTCADCRSYARCEGFIGPGIGKNTSCDWSPSRFVESRKSIAADATRAERERLLDAVRRKVERFERMAASANGIGGVAQAVAADALRSLLRTLEAQASDDSPFAS